MVADQGGKGSTPRVVIARLLARAGDEHAGALAPGDALRRVCEAVTANMRESLGPDGCDALLARALARAQVAHPALATVQRGKAASIDLLEAVAADGLSRELIAGVEEVLTAAVGILGRLIGEDMATRIVDPETPDDANDKRNPG